MADAGVAQEQQEDDDGEHRADDHRIAHGITASRTH